MANNRANNRASQLLIVAFCTYTKFIAASDVSIESQDKIKYRMMKQLRSENVCYSEAYRTTTIRKGR